jgi:tetratricopeptide (TPR) repeat protein
VRDPRTSVDVAREGIEIARRYGLRGPTVVMATNGVESAIRAGEWEWASAELHELLAMDLDDVREAIALALWVTLRALRGEDLGSDVQRVNGFVDQDDTLHMTAARDAMHAWIADAAGDGASTYRAWMSVADESPLNEPQALMLAGRAAITAGEFGAAQAALDRLDRVGAHGGLLEADRRTILAALAASEGRRSEAIAEFREALRRWRDMRMDFEIARCGLEFVTQLPDEPEAREAAEEARRIFETLRARPYLARVNAALGKPAAGRGRRSASAPAGEPAEELTSEPASA